jgi:hypothetical protein
MIHIFCRGLCAVLAIFFGCLVNGVMASELGSPAETHEALSNDYAQLVERALPKFDRAILKSKFEGVIKKYPRGLDTIKVRSLGDVERLMKLNVQQHAPTTKAFRQEGLAYEVHPEKGKIQFFHEITQPLSLSKAQGLQRLPEFTRRHEALIEQLGVTKEQTFFKNTSLLMSQGSTNPQAGPVKKTDPIVRGVTTHVVRAIDGIIVEGSSAKITSFSADKINSVRLKWPGLRFHPGIKSYEVKSQQNLKLAIADRVRTIAGRERANVKMAVVLLPISEGETSYMVPVMKVAVRTDAAGEGVVFYEGLLTQALQIEKPVTDKASGGTQGL